MLLETLLPIAVYCIFLFNIKIQENDKMDIPSIKIQKKAFLPKL